MPALRNRASGTHWAVFSAEYERKSRSLRMQPRRRATRPRSALLVVGGGECGAHLVSKGYDDP